MKRNLPLSLLFCLMAYLPFAQIVSGEYFWNTDPGHGNATEFTIDPQADSVAESFDVPLAGLKSGRNLLYTRLKEDGGNYGIARSQNVYVRDILSSAEYFWDLDPGCGLATPIKMISYSDSAMACGNVSTTALGAGIHYLFIRMRSEDGSWAVPTRTELIISANATPSGCGGDYDVNGQVNTVDLLIFLGAFGEEESCFIDLTDDFTVNTSDLLLFLGIFGQFCP
ncbi:MAG: hypothetical protein SH856_05395 [Flavobacteriales bacterium]|nr:hypothetical protein [Flavobacteriales bacterium]